MSLINFDKSKVREQLSTEDVFELLDDFGGNPEYADFGIVSATICHNPPGEGSKKLYYYKNTTLFKCYTGCAESTFDIFELTIKVFKIQRDIEIDLNTAVRYIAGRFGISGEAIEEELNISEDWKIFNF